MKEGEGEPDIVVTDVASLTWPEELDLTMTEKVIVGADRVVFMLRPSP